VLVSLSCRKPVKNTWGIVVKVLAEIYELLNRLRMPIYSLMIRMEND
jgi:hypothetical protein